MDISLYTKKIGKINKKQKLIVLLTRSALVWLLVLGVLMVGISFFSLSVNKKNLSLDSQIKRSKTAIEALSEVESQQLYLTSKLDSFEELVKSQEVHHAITETIFDLIPDGTEIKGFKVETEGEIVLSGSAPSYLKLSELLDRVRDAKKYRLDIKSAKVNKISLSRDGSLTFDIRLTLDLKS